MSGRDAIEAFLRRQLIGPVDGADETLSEPPDRRYLMGTLFPQDTDSDNAFGEEDSDQGGGNFSEDSSLSDDPVTLANTWMPSSMGISFFFAGPRILHCRIWGARYDRASAGSPRLTNINPAVAAAADAPVDARWRGRKGWRRIPIAEASDPQSKRMTSTVDGADRTQELVLEGAAILSVFWRPVSGGTLATVTLINAAKASHSEGAGPTIHQVGLTCETPEGQILEYPSVERLSTDPEDQELTLAYRHTRVFAVGHGCAATWDVQADASPVSVACEFLPRFEVPPLRPTGNMEDPALSLGFLADDRLPTADLIESLQAFIRGYANWIEASAEISVPRGLTPAHDRIMARLRRALARVQSGIQILSADPIALRAFRLANRAMALQMKHSHAGLGGSRRTIAEALPEPRSNEDPDGLRWYPFQLAFQLLVIPSLADSDSEERGIADLLWFPTGGGKTEAYLFLAAFEIFVRRLRHGRRGGGTAVITRYTLRLLTTQQFERAAALICACEIIRREQPDLGDEPITIGLWVGEGATPNKIASAIEIAGEILSGASPDKNFQLAKCPWCGTEIIPQLETSDRTAYGFDSTNEAFRLNCPSPSCDFHSRLPINVVDEMLYREPPSLLISTVDKFARLAWEERAGAFFGNGTLPPGLIIQDELHLLSGPLGTTVGVYEGAIEALIELNGPPPKVIASTATIRRAGDQVRGLFNRTVDVFPPQGVDARDSHFARVDSSAPGRLFVGVMTQSHTPTTGVVHLGAALSQAPIEVELTPDELDGYWTQVAYHNSLRELGKTRTLARDDIPARIRGIARDTSKLRQLTEEGVIELTSNVSGSELPHLLERLGHPHESSDAAEFVACTNMLSVGVDVPRLALMMVNGQPKSTSEYIQATSRIGRGKTPGLVVALYSASKARDRSHYESFLSYHSSLYRYVEPTSVTPFSVPSRQRALHAALVIVVRHGCGFRANAAAGEFRPDDPRVALALELLAQRVKAVDPPELDATREQLTRLCGEWQDLGERAQLAGKRLYYQAAGKESHSLLKNFGSAGSGWETLHSMRNVDRQCMIRLVGEQ